MQLDAIGRDAILACEIIKEPDAGNLHWHVGVLETGCRRKHRIELRACMRDAGSKRAARSKTTRIRYFGDHGASGAIA